MEGFKQNYLYDIVLPRVAGIGWLLALAGLAARYALLSVGSILLMVGLGNLALVYFMRAFEPVAEDYSSGFWLDYQSVSDEPALLRKFQYIATSSVLIGILFKLLFWNGAAVMLSAGVLVVVPTLSLQQAAGQLPRPILLIAGLGLTIWAIPSDSLVRIFYRDDPALVEKMLFQQTHPHDRAANAEVVRLLQTRRERK